VIEVDGFISAIKSCESGIVLKVSYTMYVGWWRGTVVERRSLAGELSLSCARPAVDG